MKPLYALPDHEVIKGLIPGIADRQLSASAALERIHARVTGAVGLGR